MPNAKSLENLKAHHFTSEQSRDKAAINGKKGGIQSGKSKTLRKLGLQMLSAQMEVDAQTLKMIKHMGFDTEKPEMQMVLLARLGAIAVSDNPDLMLKATQLLMEITGNDVRSINAAEQRAIERERLALEREKIESANKHEDDVPVLIDRRPDDE